MSSCEQGMIGESEWTEEAVREELSHPDLTHAWLLRVDAAPAGVALLYRPRKTDRGLRVSADGYVHSAFVGRGVGSAILTLTEKTARAGLGATGAAERAYLHNATFETADATRLYAGHGYQTVRGFLRMAVDLETEPQVTAVPGVTVRPFVQGADDHDVWRVVETSFTDHWEHAHRPYDEWRVRRMESPSYDPGLWFVAEAAGEVVGALIGGWKSEGDFGLVETLGVLAPWRRRGIAEALLRSSFAEFWRRGERRVGLGVDESSPTGATRVYERVGMHVVWRAVVYEKELHPGEPRCSLPHSGG